MSDAKTVLPETGRVPLWNAPIGLFKCDGELCLKTEYRRNDGWIEAYIVSSGEAFWGPPPQTLPSQTACLVEPVDWEVIEGMTVVLEVALYRTQAALATLQARVEALETQYHDLLMSVETKHEGETRHETARRYILEAEKRNRGDGKAALAAA